MSRAGSDLLDEMRRFASGFEGLIVEIHTMAGDIASGTYDKRRAEQVFAKTGAASVQLNRLLKEFLENPVAGAEGQKMFQQFFVSFKPQLERAMEEMRRTLEKPPEDPEEVVEIEEKVVVTEKEKKAPEEKNGLVYNEEFGCWMVPVVNESESSEEEEEEESAESEAHVIPVPSRIASFFGRQVFTDCHLTSESGLDCFCHRIMLAKYSKWFVNYFEKHAESGQVTEVALPVDPNMRFGEVLRLLYHGFARFTVDVIVDFLEIAEFYGMEVVEMIANDQLEAVKETGLSKELVLELCERFIRSGLVKKALSFAPQLAEELVTAISKGNQVAIQRIYEVTNPELFAVILQQKQFRGWKRLDKARLIDQYVGDREISDQDKRYLSIVVGDWSDVNAYHLLVHTKCNWVTPDLARAHYKHMISIMRNNLGSFEREIAQNTGDVGNLYAYSWIHFIQFLGSAVKESPVVNVVELSRTLGIGATCDPVALGMLKCTASKPVSPRFAANYALFDQKNYFLSSANRKEDPDPLYITVEFGTNSCLLLKAIEINCSAQSNQNVPRLAPGPLTFTGITADGTQEVIASNVDYTELPDLPHGQGKIFDRFQAKSKYRAITITEAPSPYGVDVLRILHLEFRGRFLY